MASLSLEKLDFDPSSVAAGPKVGSYVVDAAGNVVTSTLDGSKQALDVHLANTGNISVSVANTPDVRLQDGAGTDITSTLVGAKQSLDVNVTQSAGLYAEDSAHVSGDIGQMALAVRNDAGGSLAGADGDYSPLQLDAGGNLRTTFAVAVADDAPDTENPLKVGAHARSAASALPAVANGDKADLTVDLYRRVYINDAPNVNLLAQGITVGTSAVALPATSLAGRTRLMIQNRGGQSVFVGGSGVTISSGMEVTKGATMTLEAGPALVFYAISGAAGNDVRIIEIA